MRLSFSRLEKNHQTRHTIVTNDGIFWEHYNSLPCAWVGLWFLDTNLFFQKAIMSSFFTFGFYVSPRGKEISLETAVKVSQRAGSVVEIEDRKGERYRTVKSK